MCHSVSLGIIAIDLNRKSNLEPWNLKILKIGEWDEWNEKKLDSEKRKNTAMQNGEVEKNEEWKNLVVNYLVLK